VEKPVDRIVHVPVDRIVEKPVDRIVHVPAPPLRFDPLPPREPFHPLPPRETFHPTPPLRAPLFREPLARLPPSLYRPPSYLDRPSLLPHSRARPLRDFTPTGVHRDYYGSLKPRVPLHTTPLGRPLYY